MVPVLEIERLQVLLRVAGGHAAILDGVSLRVDPGEVMALVGESGAGKTVFALAVMGLLPEAMEVAAGSIRLGDVELVGASDAVLRAKRGGEMAMVFQDPQSALHPAFRVGAQVAEAVRVHQPTVSRAAARDRAVELLTNVGIPEAASRARDFPHQFSGGMRQRVMIAMAMANAPRLLIADEPTSALDVTVQAQVLDVLRAVPRATGAGTLVITHDLGVVATVADRVAVLYSGRVVESGPVREVLGAPAHPYTRGLLGAVPRIDDAAPMHPIPGQPPSPFARPSGCAFRTRCERADDRCATEVPPLVAVGARTSSASLESSAASDSSGRLVACHHPVGPS